LEDLKGRLITYKPDIVGDFPEDLPDRGLQLKLGAQVMFVKNDLSFEKTISTEKWGYKIPFEPGNSEFIFPEEDKT
jgi:hypothetical protein